MVPKTVCIVGAGPSGLVAAKQFLHHASGPSFSVTVFDKQPRIGGLWPLEKTDGAGIVHPLMVANQSRHTVQFSDLAWEEDAPQLPKAWQIGRYLQRYLERYCAFEEERFRLRLGWEVTSVQRDSRDAKKWLVATKSENGMGAEYEFDYLVVASGFFGKPSIPPSLKDVKQPLVIHSSRYRDLESLLSNGDVKGRKILIVGGQMSGVEIAGTIASHLSSAANTPGACNIADVGTYSIHHVVQRPTWVFPLTTSPAAARTAAPFLPLDLPSYNLANRPRPLVNHQGHISVDSAKTSHNMFRGVLGTDQSQFSPLLAPTEDEMEQPAYLAVSDWYTEFVRSGLIKLSKGKIISVSGTTATIQPLSDKQESFEVTDIAAIVLATGFEAAPSLNYLPGEVKGRLNIDTGDLNNTVLLGFHGTHHPEVPNLGFVGFYRSPYWGVMEMQARFLSELWTQQEQGQLTDSMQKALDQDRSIEHFAALRGDSRASQFPMGDYAFLMQEFASALDMETLPPVGSTPSLPHNGKPMDVLTPARYASKHLTAAQQAEVDHSLRQTHETALAGLTNGRFVAKAVFRSLLGEWQLERDLESKLPSHPSGHWSGTAKFLLRQGTRDGRECAKVDTNDGTEIEGEEDPGLEYLYIEEGEFKMTNGITIPATRRYIWRYDEKADKLSVWFVRTGDKFSRKDPRRDEEQMKADYLFHEVDFVVPEDYWERSSESGKGWEANAGHLCVEDFYDVKYEFKFQAVNLKEWSLAYTVKGPQKDYTIDGMYRRKAS
ncbi:hypothetical protein N0V93_003988 [Gnomoniopsis smithogilvyi]|uniref:DUF6314 domain-containing protein n=1 Tax=Gnomoniopsis smithogilvyi TaxID=1191159 RepID=A0A9W9D0J5_9PEZI|nr:hypothetical protein N0V93_003988 [Gnomoniopsis smithogilvyi]